jgi:hypothetical protein
MPTWGDILREINDSVQAHNGIPQFDSIRHAYLQRLSAVTGRSALLYAADYLNPAKGGHQVMINTADMQGLMESVNGLPGPNLDLILHSPGGQAEATEMMVRYLRNKYSHIRVIIPFAAMSAATMWAMSADEIVMGAHSQVGPIDPQLNLPTGLVVPAGALIGQFREIMDECSNDPSRITAWLPTLQQYPPGLLNICEASDALAKLLVSQWLKAYLLKGLVDSDVTATAVADWLADGKVHLSHSRAITREDLKERGVPVVELESDPALQDAVLSVHHATLLTFAGTPVTKIVENNLGRSWIQHAMVQGHPQ